VTCRDTHAVIPFPTEWEVAEKVTLCPEKGTISKNLDEPE